MNISYMPFKLNYRYYPCSSLKEDIDPYLKSSSIKKLAKKL